MSSPANDTAVPAALFRTEGYRTRALVSVLRLHWFIRLRWVFVLVAFAVLTLERFTAPDTPRPWELAAAVCAVALANLVWTATSRLLKARLGEAQADEARSIRSAQVFANAQVAADMLLLTLILRYTGGVENPMSMFYVFHIAISALLLQKTQALLQAAWAVVLFAGLAFGELFDWLTPHFAFLPVLPAPGWHGQPEFVIVAVGVVSCGVFGVLYFTLHIVSRLDKSERQLLEVNAALRRSQTAIQDLQTRRSRFMQNAAHQLKSPLAVVQTLAGLISDGIIPAENVRPTAQKITQRCRDGIVQVTELLTLARVQEASPQRHHGVLTDLAKVTLEVCRRYKPVAERKQVALSWRVPEARECLAHVDPRDASDCIGNLVDNAIKYTPEGGAVVVKVACVEPRPAERRPGGPPAIDPDGVASSGHVYVSVRDTGIGIDRDALSAGPETSSIFDAFRRGSNALAAGIPGSGLGLSIVREVVEQAGGRITAHSRPGHGSTFTVMFPSQRRPGVEALVRDTRSSEIVIEPVKTPDEAATPQHHEPGERRPT